MVRFLGPFALDFGQSVRGQPGWCLRKRGVDAENVRRESAAENRGDIGSPVAAVGCELAVTEPAHQFHPCGRDLFDSPPGGDRFVAVAKAWERWGHDVERWRVCIFGVCQLVYYVDEFGNTAWPAVRHDQRSGIYARGSAVQEVDSQTINGGAGLADPVESLFERPPVVPGLPVVHDINEVGQRNALFPSARVGRGAIDRLGLR